MGKKTTNNSSTSAPYREDYEYFQLYNPDEDNSDDDDSDLDDPDVRRLLAERNGQQGSCGRRRGCVDSYGMKIGYSLGLGERLEVRFLCAWGSSDSVG
jgi:hypothetical protein